MTPRIAWALENKPRIPVVWIHGLECTCCTESFIRSSHPLAKDVILSLISLDYDDTLMAAAGTQAEEVFEDILSRYHGRYILAVEGNPPLGEQGMFCISGGRPFIEKLKRAAAGASAIIAWGTCASWGCVQAARPNPTQATPIDKVITDKPIVKVPGYWLWTGINGYVLLSQDPNGPSNPLLKAVTTAPGAWMAHFENSPLLLVIPLLGMIFPMLAIYACGQRRAVWGFLFASLTQTCVIFTAGITLFPFVMPSSAYPLSSLTVWDSTSSQITLSIMLVIVLIFLPIVLLYTLWSYYKMLGRINVETIRRHNHELY